LLVEYLTGEYQRADYVGLSKGWGQVCAADFPLVGKVELSRFQPFSEIAASSGIIAESKISGWAKPLSVNPRTVIRKPGRNLTLMPCSQLAVLCVLIIQQSP
jgi:hypothetical protein